METAYQTCERLIGALEDIAAQEAASLGAGDYATILALQERSAPLVEHLVAHGPQIADSGVRNRIVAWFEGRRRTDERLADDIAKARIELRQVETNRRQAARVAPAYACDYGLAGARRLHAVG